MVTIYYQNIMILWADAAELLQALEEVTSRRLADDNLYSTDNTERGEGMISMYRFPELGV